MSGWGCPHYKEGHCGKVTGRECDPGMKGCVLFGRYSFANEDKNPPAGLKRSPGRKKKATKAD